MYSAADLHRQWRALGFRSRTMASSIAHTPHSALLKESTQDYRTLGTFSESFLELYACEMRATCALALHNPKKKTCAARTRTRCCIEAAVGPDRMLPPRKKSDREWIE